MSRFNTGNKIDSDDLKDLSDNAKNMDLAANSDMDTFKDRLGRSRLTWAGIEKAGSGDPAIAVDAAARAEAAASTAEAAADNVEQNAEQIAQDAAAQVIAGVEWQVAVAQGAADRAETARDAAFVNADVYPDAATGRAAVADGEQFQVLSDDGLELIRRRRDSANASTEVARFPSAEGVRSSVKNGVSSAIAPLRTANVYADSGFREGLPAMRNGSPTLVPITDVYLNSIGADAGVSNSESAHFMTADIRPEWIGRYCIMSFFAHFTDGSSLSLAASLSGFLVTGSNSFNRVGLEYVRQEIDSQTTVVFAYGRIPEGVNRFAIGAAISGFNTSRLIAGPAFAVADAPILPVAFAYDVLYPFKNSDVGPEPEPEFAARARVPVGAQAGYVEGACDGVTVRREFIISDDPLKSAAFNFSRDIVGGVTVREVVDDIAPYRAEAGTLGANHSYYVSQARATGHGKTLADRGSIYRLDGVEYLLIREVSSNDLLMTPRTAPEFMGTVPVGTYTHVSGGTSTTPIIVTSQTATQWYSAMQARHVSFFADGNEVDAEGGEIGFNESFKVFERYEFVSKSDLVAWCETYGASGAERPEELLPVFSVSICYRFDTSGQCTIYSDWIAHKDTSIEGTQKNYMFLQAQIAGMTDYYIPKALPFTHEGFPVDYAMIEPARLTVENNLSSVEFYPERCEPDGIFADRGIALKGQDYGFAMGFLPLADAGIEDRRANATVKALQIRGNTGKLYMTAVDVADDFVPAGTSFGIVGYRNIFPLNNQRTDSYVVRTDSDAYWYMDWHDTKKIDTLTTPRDLIGRNLEIVESSDSVRLLSSFPGKSITVQVDADNSYGYLILKISK